MCKLFERESNQIKLDSIWISMNLYDMNPNYSKMSHVRERKRERIRIIINFIKTYFVNKQHNVHVIKIKKMLSY